MGLDDQLSKIIKLFKVEFSELLGVYLFGSHVTGETHSKSDLDLALLFPAGHGPSALQIYLQGKVADIAGCSVDLGLLNLDNVVFSKEVVTTGRRLYCRDEKQCA